MLFHSYCIYDLIPALYRYFSCGFTARKPVQKKVEVEKIVEREVVIEREVRHGRLCAGRAL
jgi:hypothetical protein